MSRSIPLAVAFLCLASFVSADELPIGFPQDDPGAGVVLHVTGDSAIYGPDTDWKTLIDQTWGPSPLIMSERLGVFDTFWVQADQSFACFQGIDVDWKALKTHYRLEVALGVSRGRFAAIMNHLSRALRESHTNVRDLSVNRQADLKPGVPLFAIGNPGPVTRFGAALTPLADSSLLVYNALPNHPLGLVPGDIVLGYQGIPWKRIYPELLAAELPICAGLWGSSPSSYTHKMLMGCGLNWHLFDTIDVVKYATGDTVHLPVAPLAAATDTIDTYEQMPVPGVLMPRWGDWVSWGIVDHTHIGYVYVRGWIGNTGQQLRTAVDSLLQVHHVEGLIFDFRTNFGGDMFLGYDGLEQLVAYPTTIPTVEFDVRCGLGHFDMCPASGPDPYVIHGQAASDFPGPIAVLVGPCAVSAGDQVANLFRFLPRTRFFGKSTATAFNAPAQVAFPVTGWTGLVAVADAHRVGEPGQYLTHDEFPVDEPVWLTPASVARGEDDVVHAALQWMRNAYTATLVTQFTATPRGRGIELRWSFGMPERFAGVAIECAPDRDGPWTPLTLEVQEDRGESIAIDEPGARFYRLQLDLTDGSRTMFGPVASGVTLAGSELTAWPNPSSGPVRLDFSMSRSGWVRITVVDVAGRVVRRLVDDAKVAGPHALSWDGLSDRGLRVPAGIYFVRMAAPDRLLVRSVARVP